MTNLSKNYQELILKYIYNNFTKHQNNGVPFLDITKEFKSLNPREIKYWLNILEKKQFIRIIGGINQNPSDLQIKVKLEGLMHYEKFYSKNQDYFTSLAIDILHLYRKIEKEEIDLDPGSGNQVGTLPFSKLFKFINRSEQELNNIKYVIHEIDKYSNNIGWAGKGLILFSEIEPFVTEDGREFLEYQLKLQILFQNITDDYGKKIILEEYKDIKNLLLFKKWKDIAIKMGSILEYLITEYFSNCLEKDKNFESTFIKRYDKNGNEKRWNLLDENTSFAQKLKYILENETFGQEFNSDWKFLYNNIRDYRNYVHLTKLVKEKVIFTEEMIEQIYPTFERLIILF